MEQLSEPKPQLNELPYGTRVALGAYAVTARLAEEAMAKLEEANEVIRRVNEELPDGYMVGTRSSYSSSEFSNGQGGFNTIYRITEGSLTDIGSICTDGASYPFLGNRIEKDNDKLVVVNDELGLGLEVKEEVFVVNTLNDADETTVGGSSKYRFENRLLPLLEQIQPGEKNIFDCSYY